MLQLPPCRAEIRPDREHLRITSALKHIDERSRPAPFGDGVLPDHVPVSVEDQGASMFGQHLSPYDISDVRVSRPVTGVFAEEHAKPLIGQQSRAFTERTSRKNLSYIG
jgi:hypothetical protein